jgi:ABC-type transport system involved in multi-copper enzyme maturation permease subunit
MLRLIGVELFKLKKRWLVYGLLIALLIFTVIPIITAYTSYQSISNEGITATVTMPPDGDQTGVVIIDGRISMADTYKDAFTLPGAIEGFLQSVSNLGPLLVIVLVASAVGSEYRWGTLRQTLTKGTGRARYLGSKLSGIAIMVLIGILIALLAAFITSLITTAMLGEGFNWEFLSADYAGYLFASLGRLLLTLGVFFTFTALIATWLRSVTAGMSLGIVYFFADTIIYHLFSASTGWLSDVAPYTVTYNMNQFFQLYTYGVADPNPWLKPTLILLGYCLVFLAVNFYVFRRQDIAA